MRARGSHIEKLISYAELGRIFDCKTKHMTVQLAKQAKLTRVPLGMDRYKFRFEQVEKLIESGFIFKPKKRGNQGSKWRWHRKKVKAAKVPVFDPKITDRKGAMEMLGYRSRTSMRQLQKAGKLKSLTGFGKTAKYKIADIERIIEERQVV